MKKHNKITGGKGNIKRDSTRKRRIKEGREDDEEKWTKPSEQ